MQSIINVKVFFYYYYYYSKKTTAVNSIIVRILNTFVLFKIINYSINYNYTFY